MIYTTGGGPPALGARPTNPEEDYRIRTCKLGKIKVMSSFTRSTSGASTPE